MIPAPIRRYAYGVAAASVLGFLVLAAGVFLILDESKVAAAAEQGEESARRAARQVFDVLDRKLASEGRPPWTEIGAAYGPEGSKFPFDEIFGRIEGVAAVRVRAAAAGIGPATFATDPAEAARETFIKAPAGEGSIRIARDDGARTLTAAFRVPRASGPFDGADVNVIVLTQDPAAIRAQFEFRVYIGGTLVGLLIYLMAACAYFMRRHGERVASRARETDVRLRAVRDVSGGIAHELRNPLNAVGLSVQVIERRWPAASRGDEYPGRQFERVHLEIGRIKKVVDAFVRFARQGDLTLEDLDFSALVEEVAASFGAVFAEAGAKIDILVAPGGTIQGDRTKLWEAVSAVLQSAVDAMKAGGGGELRIRLAVERREIRLAIRDSGPALDAERLRNVFEPYAQARDQEGFGLTVAKTIVEGHGGRVEAASPPDRGCEVLIVLPRRRG